jgi:hypothetical protein
MVYSDTPDPANPAGNNDIHSASVITALLINKTSLFADSLL